MGENLPSTNKYVTDALKDLFVETIDQLIVDLGRTITLYFEPSASGCPNCGMGPDGKSNGVYNASNPFPLNEQYHRVFPDGSICPICRGSHKILTEQSQNYTALINRAPKDLDYEAIGAIPQNVYTTKCQVVAYDDIKRAKFAIIDGERCVRIRMPTKTGLKDLKYVKGWWKRED